MVLITTVNCGRLDEQSQFCHLSDHSAELSDLDLKLANHSLICMNRLVLFVASLRRLLRWLVTAFDHRFEFGKLSFAHIYHKLQIRNQFPTRVAVQPRRLLWLFTFIKLKLLFLALKKLFFSR